MHGNGQLDGPMAGGERGREGARPVNYETWTLMLNKSLHNADQIGNMVSGPGEQ